MNRTWITSDIHFGHTNIMSFCRETRARFNNDVDYMDNAIVEEWNAKVQPEDVVYILGDVSFRSATSTVKIMKRLMGKKILIEGNHDRRNLRDPAFRKCFEEIHVYHDMTYDKHRIIMFHYPISEWDQMHRGSLHFHGHLHGNPSTLEKYRALDVGMDSTGEVCITMEQAIRRVKDNPIRSYHQIGE
jgi:calcineurin-like phosphoesterase family protein